VTLNYRLNVLGFLNTGDRHAPGNFGIRDIIFALQWVRDNIEVFGGNPEDVTIQGISAGSMLVHALTLSPAATGLFHKAISQAGSMFTTDAFNPNPSSTIKSLARRLYLHYNDMEDLVDQLRRVSMKRLIGAANVFDKGTPAMYELGEFTMTLDPLDSLEIRIITDHPHNLIQRGITNRVPYLMGFSSVEQLGDIPTLAGDETVLERFTENKNLLVPQLWELQPGSAQAQQVIASFQETYFGGKLNSSSEVLWQWANYASDRHFIYGMSKISRAHSSVQDVYFYKFSYSGSFNFYKVRSGLMQYPGASHTEDANYMQRHNTLQANVTKDDPAFEVRAKFTKLFANFIMTGNPTPNDTVLGFQWSKTTPENQEYLEIDGSFAMRSHPYKERMDIFMEFDRQFLSYSSSQRRVIPSLFLVVILAIISL
jgi:bile salt-stimulated lipase